MKTHWLRPVFVPAVALVSFTVLNELIGWLLNSGDTSGRAKTPGFVLWTALVAASLVLYGFLFTRTLPLAVRWRHVAGVRIWWPLVVYVVFVAALVVFLWVRSSGFQRLSPTTVGPVSRAIVLIGAAAVAPAVLALWLVHWRVRRIGELLGGKAQTERTKAKDILDELMKSRHDMGVCLTVLVLIVTSAVVNAGAQQRAFVTSGTSQELFQPQAILLYGALFTVATMLLYVPIFVAWRTTCHRFVDDVYPPPEDARPTDEWLSGRTRLTSYLGADSTVTKNLSAAFGILTPLAISVLAVVIPGLK
ncbi:hypothetical protein JOF56_008881 [Kibdelosporangium banguiense]|uniref:DUF1206 domain-containing protein n=1 Tax=Kibdelosporangium banguiense TaxID=1365924 RepID=A0ABS4TX34_9PSEU|nr:hypothetical protein [Kibdelosporangium banguiense]MBP2328496.1 hypothetical protein [Kibdelosporangium banguiense]